MRLSNIIISYNRKDILKWHLEEIKKQTFKDFEVIVVLDGSTDGSMELSQIDWGYQIKWFDTEKTDEAHTALARNIGVKNAKGDVFLFNDDDCIPHKRLFEQMKNVPVMKMLVGYRSTKKEWLDKELPAGIEEGAMTECFNRWKKYGEEFGLFAGGNFSVRRNDFLSVGFFNEKFTGYGYDDVEWYRRAMRRGMRPIFQVDGIILHWNVGGNTAEQREEGKKKNIKLLRELEQDKNK